MTISQTYPRLAFCSAITPADPAHYLNLRKAGINTASVCLHVSGFEYYKFATIHTQLARKADLVTHAFMITDLLDPFADVTTFFKRFNQLGYDSSERSQYGLTVINTLLTGKARSLRLSISLPNVITVKTLTLHFLNVILMTNYMIYPRCRK